ncbi:putative germ cell-less protein-like 1-like [Lasiodiplodia theobromae]|uniref:Putative germ cell-less protein-like 1-like n=1 Tax=Lasiodiplodia theobromae TaxID=45133 RepID=A0A5N5DBR9_9PEZI|nr:putative germ cell-less protein-like 1-like [Lasiodiplodia theobromae]
MDGHSGGPPDFHHLVSHLNLDPDAWQSSQADGTSSTVSSVTDGLRLQSAIPAQLYPTTTTSSPRNSLFSGPPASAPPSNSSRPLLPPQPITSPPSSSRRSARFDVELPGRNRTPIARVEKDVDDPTTPVGSRRSNERSEHQNLTTLSRLFAGTSPSSTRSTPYSRMQSSSAAGMIPGSLSHHVYTRGLLDGRHSDIIIVAFGKRYRLHRLVLDQAPFFSSMLSGPWRESRAEEVTLHPEGIDHCISEAAFELTLKRLYGFDISEEEDSECLGLFATACWLEMQDLIDSSIDAILRRMHPDNLGPLIKLVTLQYYGRAGERLLASAKAMLCRDGCEMKLKNWDEVPGEIVREIVGGDGFYIHGEWERWVLAKRLLDRRLKKVAAEFGLIKSAKSRSTKAPDMLGLMAVRFDSVYRQNAITTGLSRQENPMDEQQKWMSLYTHHDIEPLLVLLEEGIHYIHLEFEQLQFIRTARDTFGLPIVSEKAITNALWMQMELRQKVLSANPQDMELGLSKAAEQEQPHPQSSRSSTSSKGKQTAVEPTTPDSEHEEMDSGSWDANGKPRKFWIPSADCNIVMGGAAEPVITTTSASPRHASRLSATLQPEDVQWATDFSVMPDANRIPTPFRPGSSGGMPTSRPKGVSYTHFPPFRFAAEFPNPRLLKEKKRVYSRTVFYAGSLWNIYIQKVRSSKNPQLGVYLHRAKEYSAEDGANTGEIMTSASARIGELERRILVGGTGTERSSRRSRQAEQVATAMMGIAPEDDNTSSGGDGEIITTPTTTSRTGERPSRHRSQTVPPQADLSSTAGLPEWMRTPWTTAGDTENDEEDESDTENLTHSQYVRHRLPGNPYYHPSSAAIPPAPPSRTASTSSFSSKHGHDRRQPESAITIPPYIDGRPTIKTYFKIYSPSKGGRLLSVYESAPDRFNFSQSWGWKSSTLMLDDTVAAVPAAAGSSSAAGAGADAGDILAGTATAIDGVEQATQALAGEVGAEGSRASSAAWKERGRSKKGDGLLRFMVVIGNL